MTPRLTIVLGLLSALSCFCLGLWAGRQTADTKIIETKVYAERQEDKKATLDEARFAVREQTVTRPDGTKVVTKTTKLSDKHRSSETAKKEKAQETVVVSQARPGIAEYRLSVQAPPSDMKDVRVGLGRRLLGPVWGEVTVRPKTREATIGIGLEF